MIHKYRVGFFLIFALLLSVFCSSLYFNQKFPYTHDGENHLVRFANYKVALKELQLPPRFAPNLVNRYGYPVFNLNYPLANILSVPFSAINVHYELTFKIIVFLSLCSGLMGVYYFTRKYSVVLSGTAMLFYLSSPYIVNLVYYRGSIGEILSYVLLPWLLLTTQWITNVTFLKQKQLFFSFFIWTLFLLSHNVTAFFGVLLYSLYVLFTYNNNKRVYLHFFVMIATSICLSLWFWLPAFIEKNETVLADAQNNTTYTQHFATINQLLLSPVKFGLSYPGSVDTLSFAAGISQLVLLVVGLALLVICCFKKTFNTHKQLVTQLVFPVMILFFQLQSSGYFWSGIPFLSYIQFPWRLGIFLPALLLPLLLTVYTKARTPLRLLLTVIVLLQFICIWQKKPVDYFHRDPIDYELFSQTTTTQNENLPKTFTYTDIGNWRAEPQLISGKGEVTVNTWNGSRRSYHLKLTETSTIAEPTMYYSGWRTTANNKKVAYINNQDIKGRVGFVLEPGEYTIYTRFTEQTYPRVLGDSISFLTLLLCLLYSIKLYKNNHDT